jgi:hypothetical protein
MPTNYHTFFKYAGIAAIILLLAGLLGWYFFLRNQTNNIEGLDAARGFDIAVPSFTGSRSSTAENVASGFGAESQLASTGEEGRPPRLWRASTPPIAGFSFLAGSTTIRYVERSTGHVYDVNPTTGSATRITKELLPKVYDAGIIGTTGVLLRMLNEEGVAVMLLGTLGTTTSDGFRELTTSNLGATVRSAAASPTLPEIVMLAEGEGNTAHLLRADADGGSPRPLLSLGVSGFAIDWPADGRLFLAELPASGVRGNAYEVVGGGLVPVLRGVSGLMMLPRASSNSILFSSDDGSRVRLFARSSASSSATELSLQTIADKCAWAPAVRSTTTPTLLAYCAAPQDAPGANFLHNWLRGAVHTADAWFTIDVSAGKAEQFFIPETSVALDVERPMVDTSGEYIAFMNARDKSLWVLKIKE